MTEQNGSNLASDSAKNRLETFSIFAIHSYAWKMGNGGHVTDLPGPAPQIRYLPSELRRRPLGIDLSAIIAAYQFSHAVGERATIYDHLVSEVVECLCWHTQ